MNHARDWKGEVEDPIALIPVFNDWDAVALVIEDLERVMEACGRSIRVLIVDDASTESPPASLSKLPLRAVRELSLLHLRCNLGHERAICVGLAFVDENVACDAVVVMDGDGEDRPEDVPRLLDALEAAGGDRVIFAARSRRSESTAFRALYAVFKLIHRVLVGRRIEVGSFSVLPRSVLSRLVVVAELWNHYAAAVMVARLPHASIPTDRGERLVGRSQVGWEALVIHGLGILSVYGARIGARVLLAATAVSGVVGLGAGVTVLMRMLAPGALPEWISSLLVALTLFLVLPLVLAAAFSMAILHSRAQAPFIPLESYRHFVLEHRAA